MYQTGKNKSRKSAFSLIEIIVSLAIFSFIITTVITITISMIGAQKRIQAQLFLTQTAQITLENMSRQLRYGYNYSGVLTSADSTIIRIRSTAIRSENFTQDCIDARRNLGAGYTGTVCTETNDNSQLLTRAKNSPYIVFESQNGNPNTLVDQNAFCITGGKLYKVSDFQILTGGLIFEKRCDLGASMLPEDIIIEKLSFDVFVDETTGSENPKNPMVRVKMKLKHTEAGSVEIQTSIAQRLITYF